jgi:tetratricopeptide (TPR) repeat protein
MLRPRSIGLLLALLTLLVYLPATSNQFVNYDDADYVTDNPFVNQGLSWLGVKWAFTSAHSANWHPLTWLSHMLDCDLFHLNPAGPHLVNILLHALNAALVFALILRLTNPRAETPGAPKKNLWPAALTAALFAWHPLHVESVAWIAERKDVLSTFFSLLTLWFYTGYAQGHADEAGTGTVSETRPRAWDYGWALGFFAMALMSKAMPVPLPLVLLLLDIWPLRRLSATDCRWKTIWPLLREKIPFFLFSALVCLITIRSQHHAESSLSNVSLGLRLENVTTAYVSYLLKMIWPLHLAVFYPLPAVFAWYRVAASALVLAGISFLAWQGRQSRPWLLVGWLWFLVTLLPVIGLLQVGAQAMADRYSYFPLIGIFIAISFSLSALAAWAPGTKPWITLAAFCLLTACVSLTERQLDYWHDGETLFEQALAVADSDVAHLNLGEELQTRNQKAAALDEYILAWRINPGSVLCNANIAGILAEQNRPETAAIYYQRAVNANNWLPSANDNYGRVLVTLKRYDEALKQFAAAEKIDPSLAQPHVLAARVYLTEGRDGDAVKELHAALALEPNNPETLVLIVSVLASSEDPRVRKGTEAYELAKEAIQLTQSRQAAPYDVLAMSFAEQGKFGTAALTEERAIQLAEANGQTDGLDLLQKRLLTFQKHQPWRESFKSK